VTEKRAALLLLLLLTACDRAPGEGLAADADEERIECALEGATSFDRSCTVEEMSGTNGAVLVVGRDDVGYRRLQIATDGRGVASADGAESAKVTIIGDRLIEVAIGSDRYRLSANIGGVE